MVARRLFHTVVDDMADLAVADCNAIWRRRVALCAACAGLLTLTLGPMIGATWTAITLGIEVAAQTRSRRQLAMGCFTRGAQSRLRARTLLLSVTWAAVPTLFMVAEDGRFAATCLIVTAGSLFFAAGGSFRASVHKLANALPPAATVVALVIAIRQSSVAAVAFAAAVPICFLLAVDAARTSHLRLRMSGRTRTRLTFDAEQAGRLALDDQLTGLLPRRQLILRLEEALAQADRRGEDVALLLIDLDWFKFVNETHGYAAGDIVLREVAGRLKRASRCGDVCAQLGDDEFVVLAARCGPRDAAAVAQRLLNELAEPVRLPSATISTAGSIGISLYSGGVTADRDLLRQADVALSRAKQSSRNSFSFFETEMDIAVRDRRDLEADLRAAVAAGEIGVVYQPQFERGAMTGVEALARWTHPVRGAVAPNFFIPLAEELGLIEQLGMNVIRRAFADSSRWSHLTVAINLSAVQLKMPSFLTELRDLVEHSQVAPQRIEFELTETVLFADDIQTQSTLATLRSLGFAIALDDFGIGYSSLSYLRQFPINKIKIDRSFISGLPEDKVSAAVVRAIVRLGHSLGLKVLAEGVETEEQMQVLSRSGCRFVQGFLTGRPVPAEGIDEVTSTSWSPTFGKWPRHAEPIASL